MTTDYDEIVSLSQNVGFGFVTRVSPSVLADTMEETGQVSLINQRGHPVDYKAGRFLDTGEPYDRDTEPPCAHCHLVSTDGTDPCIGFLDGGVTAACCGHGIPHDATIVWNEGEQNLRGRDAFEYMLPNGYPEQDV